MEKPRPVTVATPFGAITGSAVSTHIEFSSIPFHEIPGPFLDARPLAPDAARRIDAQAARPRAVALTVTTPPDARYGSDLPVICYIHGGGYDSGSHADPRTRGIHLARAGIVTVSIGYRTGLAGFARFVTDPPSHYRGVDDCARALEWVSRAIESFGGDPTNITLVGHSAGAGIALWLSRNDHYTGLFRRVVALSPAFPRAGFRDRKGSLRRALGVAVTRSWLTKHAERRPRALERGYRRFTRRHPTDMALGPFPFDAEELVGIPTLIVVTREEFYGHPAAGRLDAAKLGPAAVQLLARHMGVVLPAGDYLRRLPDSAAGHEFCHLIGDSTVRRWALDTVERAPEPHWLLEFHGLGHEGTLPRLFSTSSGELFRLVTRFARGMDPDWPGYRSVTRRIARAIDVGERERLLQVDDPLRTVRLSFKPPRR